MKIHTPQSHMTFAPRCKAEGYSIYLIGADVYPKFYLLQNECQLLAKSWSKTGMHGCQGT